MATKTPLQEYYDSINTLPTPQEDTSVISDYLNPTEDQSTVVPDIQTGNPLDEYLSSGIKENSPGFEVFQGTYTLDDLEQDPEFQMRAERFMESIKDDEDIFEYLRDSDFSLSSAIVRSGQVKGWSDQAKKDYNYLRQTFDNADMGSAGQYMQLAKNLSVDLLADPLNWLAAVFFVPSGGWTGGAAGATLLAGKEAAKISLKQIAKASLKDAKKPAIYGSVEGAAWAGPHDFFLQKADVELGLRDEVNWGQTALTTGLGAGIGGVLGGAIGTVTSGTPLLYHKYTSKYTDDLTITQKGEVKKEDAIDDYIDEKAVEIADDDFQVKRTDDIDTGETKQEKKKRKNKTVKKITRTKEAISNTVGKSVTQFVDIAQNAPRLQQLLGQYRSDWAKTLLKGNDKVMLATYGESLSTRMWGYMSELRASVGELNRNRLYLLQPSTWKNTLDKTQNDNLIWLLRLNNDSFNEIAELKKVDKINPTVPLPEERIKTASILDKDIDIEINILQKNLENDTGQIIDDQVIRTAAKIRDVLNRIYYEASGGTEVFNGENFVSLNLMTQPIGDVVGFFPRHFSYSKISEDKDGLIKLIKNSNHSNPATDPKEAAKQKVRDPITGEILLDEAGKERLVFPATELSIDQNVFGRANAAKIADLAKTDMNAAKQFKAELIVQDMLDKRYSPFEFGTENSGGGGASFLQHRVFRELDDNALAPYLDNNVEDVLEIYIQNVSRAITRTAYLGRNEEDFIKKYIAGPGNIQEQLLEAGVSQDETARVIKKLKKMYNRVTGLDASSMQLQGLARTTTDTLKLTQQMAHLPFATISSVTEPMILLSHIDDTQGKLSAGGEVGKAIIKGMKKDLNKFRDFAKRASGKEVKGFADMQDEYWTEAYKVGLALEQGVMAHIEGLYGEAPKNKFLQGMQNAFFKANFLTTWTGAVQLASFTTGKRLIRENAEKLYNHREGIQKLSNANKDYLSEQLSDLGIDEKDALRWYKNSLDNNGVFDEGRARGANKFSELKVGRNDMRKRQLAFYENRLTQGANRFTKGIILNPSTSEANRPMWFSHPAGQLLAQFAGYPTVFNNTILKRWSYESAEDLRRVGKGQIPQATPKILGTAAAMTSVAVFMNAVRSGGASLDQDEETIIIEAIQRWGGLGPADVLYRTQQNSMYGSGPAGTILKAAPGPIVSDVVDAIAYRKGIPEIFLTNTPFFSALPPEVRKDLRADARALQKSLSKGMFPDEEKFEYIAPYAKGGVVNVPNASTEPDEKKVRGMPFTYAELGGVLAQDVEDRRGFVTGGAVNAISRQSPNDEVIDHLTKEIRKTAPVLQSKATTSLYKKAETKKFSNINKEIIRYTDSDKLHDLEEELKYSTDIGIKVFSKSKKSDGKKIKYKGRLRLMKPLVLNELTSSQLKGSQFVDLLQNNKTLKNKIIQESTLSKNDATKVLDKLILEYVDTQKLLKNYSNNSLPMVQSLLDIKQSTKIRETLTDLGYDSISSNDDYILFYNNQFRINKKLKLRENFVEGGDVKKEEEEDSFKLIGKGGWLFDHTNPLSYAMFIPGVGLVGWGAKVGGGVAKAAKSFKNFPKEVYHGGEKFDKMKFGKLDKKVYTEGLHKPEFADEISSVYTSADPKYAAGYMERFRSLKTKDKGILDHMKIDDPKVAAVRPKEVQDQIEKFGYPGFMKIDISNLKRKEVHFWDKPSKQLKKDVAKRIEAESARRKIDSTIDPLASNTRIGELRRLTGYTKSSVGDPTYFPDLTLFQRTVLRENGIKLSTKSTHMDNLKLQQAAKKTGRSEPSEYILIDDFPVTPLNFEEKTKVIDAYTELLENFLK